MAVRKAGRPDISGPETDDNTGKSLFPAVSFFPTVDDSVFDLNQAKSAKQICRSRVV